MGGNLRKVILTIITVIFIKSVEANFRKSIDISIIILTKRIKMPDLFNK